MIPVFVSPLRERRQDIPLLAEHFLGEFAHEYGHRVKSLDDAALTVLKAHTWPGNVRELRNVLERLAIMVPGETIAATDLDFLAGGGRVAGHGAAVEAMPLQQARDGFERDYIVRALVAHHGNISRAAEALGVERSNLYRKMRSFGIMSPRRADSDLDGSSGRVSSRTPGLP